MSVNPNIEWIEIDELNLDARNPRLGRHFIAANSSQKKILREIEEWSLGELAVSFLESGFWTQEPPVVVEEEGRLVIIEGNRRLATLKLMALAKQGMPVSKRWTDLIKNVSKRKLADLSKVPCVRADSRKDVQAYLGFRHVSGIKQWEPTEKAQFIAQLVEDEKLTYEQVMRRIGSTTLSANITETPATFGISVGRWR